jgi:hypothetical protein
VRALFTEGYLFLLGWDRDDNFICPTPCTAGGSSVRIMAQSGLTVGRSAGLVTFQTLTKKLFGGIHTISACLCP